MVEYASQSQETWKNTMRLRMWRRRRWERSGRKPPQSTILRRYLGFVPDDRDPNGYRHWLLARHEKRRRRIPEQIRDIPVRKEVRQAFVSLILGAHESIIQ